jgi:hypothetical protein
VPEDLPDCSEGPLTTSGATDTPYYLYLLAIDASPADDLRAFELSLDYSSSGPGSGVRLLSWESYGTTDNQKTSALGLGWPAPGSSNRVVFTDGRHSHQSVQRDGRVALAIGRFYVYAYDSATLTFSADGFIPKVIDGESGSTELHATDLGIVAFGQGRGGWNPCEGVFNNPQNSQSLSTGLHLKPFLSQGQPNPFESQIQWQVNSDVEQVGEVLIVSVAGRVIRSWRADLPRGGSTVTWDGFDDRGREVPVGIYYLRLTEADGTETRRRAVLIR